MRNEGVTDYIAVPLRFIDGAIHAVELDHAADGRLQRRPPRRHPRDRAPPVARLVEVIGLRRIATTLLDTYVGSRAGERILAGQIRRGHTETMRAAIWLSDLRGFTRCPTGCRRRSWSRC